MASRLLSVVATAVLGPAGRQRVRASQSLLALVVYALFAVLQYVGVRIGMVPRDDAIRLTTLYLAGALSFYALIRSGLNERFAQHPSLTLPQSVFGMVVCAGAYAISGPARGAVLTLVVLIMVFAMFALRPNQIRALALLAFGQLAAVMLWKSHSEPHRYDPSLEAVHAVFAAIVLACVSVLAGRMGTMNARIKSQNQALESALIRIGELATRDDLTGLVNRRHMTTLLQAESRRQDRRGGTLTIALIDLDRFKHINDRCGHQAGDTVLQIFAETGGKLLRGSDVLARWGGEEFLVMLPDTTPEQALCSIERLREGLAQVSFDAIAPGLKVTFSAGVSGCDHSGSLAAGIDRADKAMYRAKAQGRDRTVMG